MKIFQITNAYKDDMLQIVKSNVPAGFGIRTLPENTEESLLDCNFILTISQPADGCKGWIPWK